MDRNSPQNDGYDPMHSSHLEETLRELEEKISEHEDTLKKVEYPKFSDHLLGTSVLTGMQAAQYSSREEPAESCCFGAGTT